MSSRRGFLALLVLAPVAGAAAPALRVASTRPPDVTLNAIDREVEALYARTAAQHQAQLDAITGGMDAEAFIAKQHSEAVAVLREIRAELERWR